jgi:2'-5' RNA ligase
MMAIADLAPGEHADQVRNHWWWRPGWRIGRRFYAFHITFDNQPELYRLAQTYRETLAHLSSLTMVPDRWLHLTMQGIGFADEIPDGATAGITDEAQAALTSIPAFTVEFGEIVVANEALALPAQPPDQIRNLRTATRTAIGNVLGHAHIPENANRYRPHVTIAYTTTEAPSAPYLAAVKSVRVPPARVRITHVDLIELHRDHRMYEWSTIARLRLLQEPTARPAAGKL